METTAPWKQRAAFLLAFLHLTGTYVLRLRYLLAPLPIAGRGGAMLFYYIHTSKSKERIQTQRDYMHLSGTSGTHRPNLLVMVCLLRPTRVRSLYPPPPPQRRCARNAAGRGKRRGRPSQLVSNQNSTAVHLGRRRKWEMGERTLMVGLFQAASSG